jgi:hypothetical protein
VAVDRARVSLAFGAVGLLSAAAFFAVGAPRDEETRSRPRSFGGSPPISSRMPGRPLAELPYERAAALTDSLVAVQRYAVAAPLSDHRPLSDSLP